MSIMWKYLDKRAAAIKAIGDYDNMQFIIQNTKDEITVESDRMVGVGSPNMDGMPHAHNPQAGEERILDGIEKIDILKERYRQAVEYMDWFQPAWDGLTDDDKYVLECFYQTESSDVNLICDHFGADDLATLPVKPSAEYSSSSSAKPPGNAPVAVQLPRYGSPASLRV